MQASPEHALKEAKRIIDGISQRKLEDLCSTSIVRREQVINKILGGLDVTNKNSSDIFQAISIELASRQEEIGALYFAETNIKNGSIFALEVLESIITVAISARKEIDMEGDTKTVDAMTMGLHSLFRAILEVESYRTNPNIYLLIGADAEYIGKPSEAIDMYFKAMELGSIESYLRIAAIYDFEHNYAMGIATLEEGYKLLGEVSFLHGLVRMHHENGNPEAASTWYDELAKKTKGKINPFLVYKGSIDNDDNLDVFENLMNTYLSEGLLEPTPTLTTLATSASEYIVNQIEVVNIEIDNMDSIPENEKSEIDKAVYMCWITRRLYLMQNHIITLRDSRYLDAYLDDINKFGINGNDENRRIIRTFFEEYFSTLVLSEYRRMSEDKNISVENMDFFEMIRVHLVQIAAIFGQGSYYDLLLEKIEPMVNKCLKLEGAIEDIPEDFEIKGDLMPLKDENDFYSSLPSWMQRSYEDFIEYFDKKYGIYYRRTIQIFARDSEYDESEHSDILRNHSDIALLFWIEKISHGGLSSEDEEPDMEDLITGYHLDRLEPVNALLFAGFLCEGESQFETAIELLINIPGIFDFTSTLVFITDTILHLDSKEEIDSVLSDLHELSREQYGSRDFFDHIQNILIDVTLDPDFSNEDMGSILLANAFRCLLQINIEEALEYFHKATQYEPMKSYIEIGDIYLERGEYDRATQAYRDCYVANPSVAGIRRLIGCCIMSGQFDRAKEYIDTAIWDDHDVSGYIFAYYLWQGREKEAMEKIIEIIQSHGEMDISSPDGTLELLATTVESILENNETSFELDTLKILASYLDVQFLAEKETVDPFKFIEHFSYVTALFDQYEGEELYQGIESTIGLMACDQSDPDEDMDRTTLIMRIIHVHGFNIHEQMKEMLKYYQNAKDLERAKDTFNAINMLINMMVLVFQRFPESDNYLVGWRRGITLLSTNTSFQHPMPETVQ